jgi:hypothetical protein
VRLGGLPGVTPEGIKVLPSRIRVNYWM